MRRPHLLNKEIKRALNIICLFSLFFIASPNHLLSQNISTKIIEKNNELAQSLVNQDILKAYEIAFKNYEIITNGYYSNHLRAETFLTLAYTYDGLNEYPKAIELVLEAILIFERENKIPSLINTQNLLGGIYYNAGNYNKAIQSIEKAIKISEKNSEKERIAVLYNNLSGAYLQLGEFNKATKYALIALDKLKTNDLETQIVIFNTFGEIYYEKELYDSAIYFAQRALTLVGSSNEESSLIKTAVFLNLSENHWALKDTINALRFAQASFKLSNEMSEKIMQLESAKILSDIWLSLGSLDSSIFYQNKYLSLENQIWNKEKVQKMYNIVMSFNENEIAIEKARNEQQKIINISILIVLLLLIFIVLVALWQNNKKKKLLKTINVQNEEIERKNHRLNEQKTELEQYHSIKDKMFSMVVHDFKTPINSLESILNLLEEKKMTPEEASDLSKRLKVPLQQSKQSTNNMIFWAKNQMAGLEANYEKIKISNFLEEIKSYHSLLLSKRRIDLKIKSSSNLNEELYFYSDKEILFMTVNNLISNAIKFSHEGSLINFSIEIKQSFVYLSVTDYGLGIKPEEVKSIFEFSKISDKGTGIGLAISKELLKKIEGEVTATSTVNTETNFTIKIPFNKEI